MLYQLGCMRKVYENYRAHESQIAQMTFSIPTWMRDYTVVEDQTPFIETTIKYFESVLDHYAKSRMVSDFDEIKSFQSGIL